MRRDRYFSPSVEQLGLIIGLVALSAFFIGLIVAYAYRIEGDSSWQRFRIPSFLWLSTTLLAISSWVIEAAKYALRRAQVVLYRGRIVACIVLGALFLALQVTAGADLLHQGVGTAANPHGSAFYVFMSVHGVHLIGGLIWLTYLYVRSRRLFDASENVLRKHRLIASLAATYWHFMGALWLVLFYFLLRWTRA